MDDVDLTRATRAAQHEATNAFATGRIDQFSSQWAILATRLASQVETLDEDVASTASSLAKQLNIIATNQISNEDQTAQEIKDSEQEVRKYFKEAGDTAFDLSALSASLPVTKSKKASKKSSSLSSSKQNLQSESRFGPWRAFFLANLSHPYPIGPARQKLLAAVPDQTNAQLLTWFVNHRRRSGWGDVFRIHCECAKPRMDRLVSRFTKGKPEESPGSYAALEAVRTFFLESGRDCLTGRINRVLTELSLGFKPVKLEFEPTTPTDVDPATALIPLQSDASVIDDVAEEVPVKTHRTRSARQTQAVAAVAAVDAERKAYDDRVKEIASHHPTSFQDSNVRGTHVDDPRSLYSTPRRPTPDAVPYVYSSPIQVPPLVPIVSGMPLSRFDNPLFADQRSFSGSSSSHSIISYVDEEHVVDVPAPTQFQARITSSVSAPASIYPPDRTSRSQYDVSSNRSLSSPGKLKYVDVDSTQQFFAPPQYHVEESPEREFPYFSPVSHFSPVSYPAQYASPTYELDYASPVIVEEEERYDERFYSSPQVQQEAVFAPLENMHMLPHEYEPKRQTYLAQEPVYVAAPYTQQRYDTAPAHLPLHPNVRNDAMISCPLPSMRVNPHQIGSLPVYSAPAYPPPQLAAPQRFYSSGYFPSPAAHPLLDTYTTHPQSISPQYPVSPNMQRENRQSPPTASNNFFMTLADHPITNTSYEHSQQPIEYRGLGITDRGLHQEFTQWY